ncbi:MAG: PilC/PilY family type IV pilus protein [Pseudomonadota bacterium]
MKYSILKVSGFIATALLLAAPVAMAQTNPGVISDSPLFLSDAVEPNVIMAIDDSGSMDFETLFPANDGALWWNTNIESFVGLDINNNPSPGTVNFNSSGGSSLTWWKFVYLFPNGCCDTGARRTLGGGHFPIPPTREFAFSRSPDFNRGYYNPDITYEPWVSSGSRTFTDVNPSSAPFDPIAESTTRTIDLTQVVPASTDWAQQFLVMVGMQDNTGNVNNLFPLYQGFDYFPATYWLVDTTATMTIAGTPVDCAAPDPANFEFFRANTTAIAGTAQALGPDGSCLVRYEVRPATPVYPSGRTYIEEIQNFANWFTYYRKRHQAMRGGITAAFDQINGVRMGRFTINNRQPVTMRSLTDDRVGVLDSIFDARGTGGTPLRESLDYMGRQFERNDANAPITNSCQKNYGIAFTDGFSNGSTPGVTGDGDLNAGVPYADTIANTMGDIAITYYENLNVSGFGTENVPTPIACNDANPDPILDCNSDLHMNTFAITLNARGTIFGVTHNTSQDAHDNPPPWPNGAPAGNTPFATRSPLAVDDLYHAAVNGRGEMLNARTPTDIATQMAAVLATVVETEGTAAAVTFNTGLLSSDSLVYQAKLDSEAWSGFLTASTIDPVTGEVSPVPSWDAADLLPNDSARQVTTYDPANGGVPFRAVGDLTAGQLADLSTNLPTGLAVEDVIDYIRGSRTFESETLFRERDPRTVLGDIVHSSPVLVGAPRSNWPNTAPFPTGTDSYETWAATQVNRREAVYAGSNDGMLHGIWADVGNLTSGQEFMGYIPNAVFDATFGEGLHALTLQNYQHRYYVDLTPAVSDAYIRTGPSTPLRWRTILVGGLRGGGPGLYALDITDPNSMRESDADDYVLWELTSDDDPDLGATFSEPTIALMNNGRWAAVFGNGYNNTGSTRAQLWIVYLEGGTDRTWTLGSDYIKIEVPGNDNGLSTPQLADLDGNGTPDRAYAGDLLGNMWAFDLDGSSDAFWGIDYGTSGSPEPLFTAEDALGNPQPITSKPVLARCPFDNSVSPDVMVLFGTGQYLTEGDKTTTDPQTFYGIWDRGDSELDRGDLLEQLAHDPALSYDQTQLRVPTNNTLDPLSEFGWYMDLPDSGERVVSNPLVRGEITFFNTIIPDSGDPCVVGGGGWLMSVQICDGARPDSAVFDRNRDNVIGNGDLVADTTLTDSNGDPILNAAGGERFNESEGLPWQSSVLGDRQYTPGSTGNIENRAITVTNDVLDGRLSWEQIINE